MHTEYGAIQFAAAGKVPTLQSVDAIVVYDPKDGRVRHIHQVLVFKGGKTFDRLELCTCQTFMRAEPCIVLIWKRTL